MRALRGLLLLGLAAALMAVVPAGASNTVRASNTVTFQDSTGEDPAAPDITTVVVSNDDSGALSFKVNIPSRPQLTRDILLDLFVDSDANPATGDPDSLGADYVVQLFLGEVALFKWDGADFTRRPGDPPATTLNYSWSGGVTIRISATELGNTKAFGFAVLAISGLVIDDVTGNIDDTNASSDVAPAGGAGFWRYDVKVAPARLVFRSLTMTPRTPKAGKTFTVRMAATRSDTNAALVNGQVDCTARAGTKAVRPTSERFVGGQAACVFKIPAGTKGKTLRGSITIIFEGKRLVRPFSAKIG
jgi:hypothetical protein